MRHVAAARREVAIPLYPVLIVVLVIVNLLRTLHHVPWGDEWQAWLVATKTPDLAALFERIRHAGHPALWYLVLRPLGSLTADPAAMQVVHWLIGTGMILLIAFASPFNRAERLLILCSYFLLSEFMVLSRSYALGALLLLAHTWLRVRRPELRVLPWLLLGLAVNTNAYAALAAGALGAAWLATDRDLQRHAVSLGLFVALSGIAVCSALPPPSDVPGFVDHRASLFTWKTPIGSVVRATTRVFLPIEDAFPSRYWNPTFGPDWLQALLALPLAAALHAALRKEPDLLLAFALGLGGVIVFSTIVWSSGEARHHGILFVLFVACLWRLRARARPLPRAALVLLVLNALGGLQAAVGEQLRPFSNTDRAAAWIEANGLADAFWIGTPDLNVIGVAGRLDRPFHFPECRCVAPYAVWGPRRHTVEPEELGARLMASLRTTDRHHAYLLLAGGLLDVITPAQALPGLDLEPLARFEGAEMMRGYFGEDIALYRLSRRPGS